MSEEEKEKFKNLYKGAWFDRFERFER
jgi:hypothetical protein